MFDSWRFHAFFTTTDSRLLDTVAADKTHRGHAIIETVHADLKNSALAHLPSGKFTANAAGLVLTVIAFNLTRAAATVTGPAWPKPPPPRSATLTAVSAGIASHPDDSAPPASGPGLADRLDHPVRPGQ